jgi:CRP-like cAMP-binding protein
MNAPDPHVDVAGQENWLLRALPTDVYARILENCETVPLPIKTVVINPDVPLDYAYFPLSGCLSMVSVMDDDTCVEVGTIGWEGMVGLSLIHGVTSVPQRCIVQVAGNMRRIPIELLAAELRDHDELYDILERYAEVWINQVSRAGSCNSVHSIEKRCARWLLLTHDRVETDELPLTQEFLAIMLGVRRASVTAAATSLQKQGLITYRHGKITIVDRAGLERASCDCYTVMRTAYTKLLPFEPEDGRPH